MQCKNNFMHFFFLPGRIICIASCRISYLINCDNVKQAEPNDHQSNPPDIFKNVYLYFEFLFKYLVLRHCEKRTRVHSKGADQINFTRG